jgi:hypothetical protein
VPHLQRAGESCGFCAITWASALPHGDANLCINGNEYAKCQLRKRGIRFEALDNGIRWCADPSALSRVCDGLDAVKVEPLMRKVDGAPSHPLRRGPDLGRHLIN